MFTQELPFAHVKAAMYVQASEIVFWDLKVSRGSFTDDTVSGVPSRHVLCRRAACGLVFLRLLSKHEINGTRLRDVTCSHPLSSISHLWTPDFLAETFFRVQHITSLCGGGLRRVIGSHRRPRLINYLEPFKDSEGLRVLSPSLLLQALMCPALPD